MRGEAKLFLIGLTIFVAAVLTAGFVIVPSPTMQRIYDLDQKRVDALDSLAAAINVFDVREHRLPVDMSELEREVPWSAEVMRSADSRDMYSYAPRADATFDLCTTFAAPSPKGAPRAHPEGHWCEHRRPTADAAR